MLSAKQCQLATAKHCEQLWISTKLCRSLSLLLNGHCRLPLELMQFACRGRGGPRARCDKVVRDSATVRVISPHTCLRHQRGHRHAQRPDSLQLPQQLHRGVHTGEWKWIVTLLRKHT